MSNRPFAGVFLASMVVHFGSAAPAQPAVDQCIAIENVTLISPERLAPLLHAEIVLRNGRIARVATHSTPQPACRRIDGTGRFLIPGLIDSHVHVARSAALDDDAIEAHPELWAAYRAQVPRAFLAFGFTTIVDLDLAPSAGAWFKGTSLHPRLYSCGRGLKVAGGYMAFKVPAASSPNYPNLVYESEAAGHWPKGLDPKEFTAERAVSRAADAGAICVKAFVESGFGVFDWPYLHTGTLQKIQAAAKARKLVLLTHANSVDSWKSALAAHTDIIAHGLWVWPGDSGNPVPPPVVNEVIAAAARSGTRIQPTLQTVAGERAMFDSSLLDDPRLEKALPPSIIAYWRSAEGVKARTRLLDEYREASPAPGFESALGTVIERTRATFKIMLRERALLIFGSDTPGVDGFGNPPGLNGRLELQNWADAGAAPALILRAATVDNATALGLLPELGTIEVGKRADLLLLKDSPLATMSAYDTIETVFLNGEPISPNALRGHD